MKVKELISQLLTMPLDAHVYHIWDGEPRTEINFIWVSKRGDVMTADYSENVYSDLSRPITADKNKDWSTPKGQNKMIDYDN